MFVFLGYRMSDAAGYVDVEERFRFPDSLTPGVAIAMAACQLVRAVQRAIDRDGRPRHFEILTTTVEDSNHAHIHLDHDLEPQLYFEPA